MEDELREVLDTAIYKEIASQALYQAGKSKTQDPGAKALMKELVEQEARHARWLKDLKERGVANKKWHRGKVSELRISEYLTSSDTLEGAGLQDTLAFAIKREQQSADFYSRMKATTRDDAARQLCEKLIGEEHRHKSRLEKLYDDLFYNED